MRKLKNEPNLKHATSTRIAAKRAGRGIAKTKPQSAAHTPESDDGRASATGSRRGPGGWDRDPKLVNSAGTKSKETIRYPQYFFFPNLVSYLARRRTDAFKHAQ
jgi:hypothetical protein